MLWCFGDSFTYGVKCHTEDEYYQRYESNGVMELKKTWPELLSDYLGMELMNVSEPGLSNVEILTNLCINLKHINENDWVVVSDTSPIRIKTFKEKRWSEVELPEHSDVVMDYILEEIIPFEVEWKNWMRDTVENVFDSLDGVHCRFWSHEIWDKFHTITQHTDGEINDLHWSWKGHEEMFKYIKGK